MKELTKLTLLILKILNQNWFQPIGFGSVWFLLFKN
jgi:hypothetical protein